MSSVQSSTHNYSFQAIPASFALGLVPHSYYLVRMMIATRNQQSNAMPRTNLDTWKTKLPPALWNHLARVRGAHLNSMEVFPLFAAAMVAGNVAGLPAQDMNQYAFSFLGARTVYMGLYATINKDILALARTGAYVWSIGIPMVCLWQANKALAPTV